MCWEWNIQKFRHFLLRKYFINEKQSKWPERIIASKMETTGNDRCPNADQVRTSEWIHDEWMKILQMYRVFNQKSNRSEFPFWKIWPKMKHSYRSEKIEAPKNIAAYLCWCVCEPCANVSKKKWRRERRQRRAVFQLLCAHTHTYLFTQLTSRQIKSIKCDFF